MKRRIEVRACSITEAGAAAVVNASNDSARLGGGVSRALFDECGGPVLQEEMNRKLENAFNGVLDEGDCMVTTAGTSTKIRHLLHVPAVDYRGTRARLGASGVERTVTSPERIQACTETALRAAADIAKEEGKPIAVAFPLLGGGAGGLRVATVCRSMIAGPRNFFAESPEAAIEFAVACLPALRRASPPSPCGVPLPEAPTPTRGERRTLLRLRQGPRRNDRPVDERVLILNQSAVRQSEILRARFWRVKEPRA